MVRSHGTGSLAAEHVHSLAHAAPLTLTHRPDEDMRADSSMTGGWAAALLTALCLYEPPASRHLNQKAGVPSLASCLCGQSNSMTIRATFENKLQTRSWKTHIHILIVLIFLHYINLECIRIVPVYPHIATRRGLCANSMEKILGTYCVYQQDR